VKRRADYLAIVNKPAVPEQVDPAAHADFIRDFARFKRRREWIPRERANPIA
jgi:hypothetical protein